MLYTHKVHKVTSVNSRSGFTAHTEGGQGVAFRFSPLKCEAKKLHLTADHIVSLSHTLDLHLNYRAIQLATATVLAVKRLSQKNVPCRGYSLLQAE